MDIDKVTEYAKAFKAGKMTARHAREELGGRYETVSAIHKAVENGEITFDKEGNPIFPEILPWEKKRSKQESKSASRFSQKDPLVSASSTVMTTMGRETAAEALDLTSKRFALGKGLEKRLGATAEAHGVELSEYINTCSDFYEAHHGQIEQLKEDILVRDLAIEIAKQQLDEARKLALPNVIRLKRFELLKDYLDSVLLMNAAGTSMPKGFGRQFVTTFNLLAEKIENDEKINSENRAIAMSACDYGR